MDIIFFPSPFFWSSPSILSASPFFFLICLSLNFLHSLLSSFYQSHPSHQSQLFSSIPLPSLVPKFFSLFHYLIHICFSLFITFLPFFVPSHSFCLLDIIIIYYFQFLPSLHSLPPLPFLSSPSLSSEELVC